MASGWRAADGSSCVRRAGPVKPKATAVAMHALDHARRPPTTTCASKRASCQMPMTEGGGRWRDSASRWSAGPTPAARPDAMPAMSEPGGRRKSRRRAGSRSLDVGCRAIMHVCKPQEPLPVRDFGEGINGPMGRPHVPLDVCRGYTSIHEGTCRRSLLSLRDSTPCGPATPSPSRIPSGRSMGASDVRARQARLSSFSGRVLVVCAGFFVRQLRYLGDLVRSTHHR